MTWNKWTVGAVVAAMVLLIGLGYGIATWRHHSERAGYAKREQERIAEITKKEAEQNQLRGENKQLREHVAELEIKDEGLIAIIEKRGGAIVDEAKNLEKTIDDLKNTQTDISNPTGRCAHCRAFSDELLRARKISKPLACKDECAGTNQ